MVSHHLTLSRRIVDAMHLDRQREEDKHRRHEEKEAARREKDRRKRERIEERELAEARERDKQAQFQAQYRTAPSHAPRPVSPYQTGGQLPGQRPVSPYQNPGSLPSQRPVSPYQTGGQLPGQRPVSPYHGGGQLPSQRPVSPYQGGGQLPGQRTVSPYHGGGQLPGQRPVSPYHGGGQLPGQRPVSPYQSGGTLPGQRPVSPYHGGGALPSTKPISPYHGGGNLPSTTSSTYYSNPNYGSAYNEVEKRMGDLGIGGRAAEYNSRKKNAGYQPAPGGDYPPGTPGSHYTTTTTVPSHSPYHPTTAIQPIHPNAATRDPYNRGPSPSPYGTPAYQPPSLQEETMLPPPEGFSRPPNAAQPYTYFENLKVQDLDQLVESLPRMPAVLTTHDVYHQDWIRFIQDLTNAWIGRLPIPESAKQDGRPPKRSVVATDLVELWNASFFIPRGVEAIVYKGRERRNGKYTGRVDTDIPAFNITVDDITDSSPESTGLDSEDDYVPPGGARYGNYGGVYGRQDSTNVEAHNARMRRKEIQEQERRKRKEKELRRRLREMEKSYTLYLTYLPA
jgi:hypothetical protein